MRKRAIGGFRSRVICFCTFTAFSAHVLGSELQPAGGGFIGRSLTFAERVACQRAIEEVYWRHRVWPKENPGPKPPLGAVITKEAIQEKISNYLAKSRVLARAQRSITGAKLQEEMNRIACDTKQPEVLLELFEALENDPSVIAECLVRPILAERLMSELAPHATMDGPFSNVLALAEESALASGRYNLPAISISNGGADDVWAATSTANAPAVRLFHSAVGRAAK